MITIIALVVSILFVSGLPDDLIVKLPYGKIRGHIRKSYYGNDYYGFQEIPYAAPPVGSNRFKEPRNPEPWSGILNTTNNTKQCIQQAFQGFPVHTGLQQTEDCLYINVFSPQKSVNSSLPVLLYIHGGGFLLGSGSPTIYNPGRFIDYDIIVVTFNYRLGVLGFLTTGDGLIPGNLGLKDQLFAMKWVNSHIHLFGGNPRKVTLYGQSAGAFSVAFHLTSNNVSGLFRAAIQESGSSLCPMTYSSKSRTSAFKLGKILNETFNSQKSEDLLNLLSNAPVEDIVAASIKVTSAEDTDVVTSASLWTPVIESENAKDPLITVPMHESFMTGNFYHVPILIGFNSQEALKYIDDSSYVVAESYDENPSLMVNSELHISEENAMLFGKKMRQIYTRSLFTEDKGAFVKYTTDVQFTSAVLRQVELTAGRVPTYLYEFSYLGKLGFLFTPNRYKYPGVEGVGHGEEILYFWDRVAPLNQTDILTMKRLLVMWTNFVKYLNPTPRKDDLLDNILWPTVQTRHLEYLNINDTLEVKNNPRYYSKVRNLLLNYIQPPFIIF